MMRRVTVFVFAMLAMQILLCSCAAIVRETGYRADSEVFDHVIHRDGRAPSSVASMEQSDVRIECFVQEHGRKVAAMGPLLPLVPVMKTDAEFDAEQLTLVVQVFADHPIEIDWDVLDIRWMAGESWHDARYQIAGSQQSETGEYCSMVTIDKKLSLGEVTHEPFTVTVPRIVAAGKEVPAVAFDMKVETSWHYLYLD